jgi:hypothetical protein
MTSLHPAMWALLEHARVPETLVPQRFGLWEISRLALETPLERALVGWPRYTRLLRVSMATLHTSEGEVVMEDSWRELRKHLPLWRAAHGRVLVTGLGLGCVVRGLLALPAVTHVDVVEIDREIVRVVGSEFAECPRVTLHHADALTWPVPSGVCWDVAWHDIWAEESLHVLHARLLWRFARRCAVQGAWGFPREFKRCWPRPLLGGRRKRTWPHAPPGPAPPSAADPGPAPPGGREGGPAP